MAAAAKGGASAAPAQMAAAESTKFGRFIHYRPSPEHDSITCEYILIRGLRTLEGGTEETAQAAIFAKLIQ